MKREEIQEKALSSWIDNDCNGALILGTGVGKTKIAIDAIKYLDELINDHFNDEYVPISVLWLTNSERLRDIDTPNDFIKWGASPLLLQIDFQCIQTAYKYEKESYNLVVVDEGDFMLTPEYFKFFTNNTYSNLLFLTATVDKSKQILLDQLTKTVFTYTTQEAQNDGILNRSNITLVKFMLDDVNKTIKSKGKGSKIFYQTENAAYEYLEKRCVLELLNVNKAKADVDGDTLLNGRPSQILVDELGKCGIIHKFWTTKRANFLWSLDSSKKIAIKLLKQLITKDNNHKALVFSKRTEQAGLICKRTYHSKNKVGNTSLEDLSEGSIRAVAVVQAVNRGVNLVGVTHIIKESYDGSSTSFQQQHGRGTRLSVDHVMNMYILVPYYKSKTKVVPTQALKWAKDMTSDFNNIKEIQM